jgi:hypothetical protein
MGLNTRGIRRLADQLVANKKLYEQHTFGAKTECGTTCCLAGFCYLETIGSRKFNALVKSEELNGDDCLKAGKKQLGIKASSSPVIFQGLGAWPVDLAEEYRQNGPRGRVIVALKALQRLRGNGNIDPNKKAVHTRLPQLKALLAKAER